MHLFAAAIVPALVLGAASQDAPVYAQPTVNPAVSRCVSAVGAAINGLAITRAAVVPAGLAPAGSGGPNGNLLASITLPEHCLIQAKFEQRTGSDGKPYAIAMELRVPVEWNGRLLFQGGGGLNGRVNAAIGRNVNNPSTAKVALARGFAVVTTDSGHTNPVSAAFADDQLAKLNYAYASIGKVVTVAKTLLAELAGKRPDRSYYAGCSNGGREAMLAAQRFPEEFDGVIAGNPAFRLSEATVMANHAFRTYSRIAPRGSDGQAITPLALSGADMRTLADGILRKCDALDGAKDGLVFDHANCRFDPAELVCKAGQQTGCLPGATAAAIKSAFTGPLRRPGNTPLFTPFTYDPGIATDGWRIWQLGLKLPSGQYDTSRTDLIGEGLRRLFHYPPITPARLMSLDAQRAVHDIAETAALIDAVSTQVSSFAAKGGKMIMVTGWSDPVFAPQDLIDWYGELDRKTAEATGHSASTFARLFMVPGMNHCGGGPAMDDFDALTSLVDWVENGKAPDRMIARGASFPGVSRPLCAWPEVAKYSGNGDMRDAANFVCARPKAVGGNHS